MNLVPVVNWFLGLLVQKFNNRPHITYGIRPEAKSLLGSSHHMLLVGTTYISVKLLTMTLSQLLWHLWLCWKQKHFSLFAHFFCTFSLDGWLTNCSSLACFNFSIYMLHVHLCTLTLSNIHIFSSSDISFEHHTGTKSTIWHLHIKCQWFHVFSTCHKPQLHALGHLWNLCIIVRDFMFLAPDELTNHLRNPPEKLVAGTLTGWIISMSVQNSALFHFSAISSTVQYSPVEHLLESNGAQCVELESARCDHISTAEATAILNLKPYLPTSAHKCIICL